MELVGSVKVQDGLFLGDQFSAQDLEFIVANKVTHVINCVAQRIPNHWASIGIKYTSYRWEPSKQLLTPKIVDRCCAVVDAASVHGEGVLIHCVQGQNQSVCLSCAYMMKRYAWTLRKTLEYMRVMKPDLRMKPPYQAQLQKYEGQLSLRTQLTDAWNSASSPPEQVLLHTYLNTHSPPMPVKQLTGPRQQRITWADQHTPRETVKPTGQLTIKSNLKGSEHMLVVDLADYSPKKPARKQFKVGKAERKGRSTRNRELEEAKHEKGGSAKGFLVPRQAPSPTARNPSGGSTRLIKRAWF